MQISIRDSGATHPWNHPSEEKPEWSPLEKGLPTFLLYGRLLRLLSFLCCGLYVFVFPIYPQSVQEAERSHSQARTVTKPARARTGIYLVTGEVSGAASWSA